ncbi:MULTISPECIES: tyrosine-type recombinase/integrase [Sphingomonas]|uniref:tyrosine-type recombinase/integrase n=1 Tax=Sphingomonas TaxID=13687 RepID=UPI00082E3AF6|nr:integrase arm-type DNA-binding domain-containing protein [Sphingomonas sp. CCH10-B3]
MLTNAVVKAARPAARAYKRADTGGLFLYVAPTGLKSWRYRYRLKGREQLLVLGRYPELDVGAAREKRDDAKAMLERGEDPRAAPSDESTRFETIARAWVAQQRERWTPRHALDVITSLERDAFPAIGALAVISIDAPMVLKLLRDVEARGSIESARRLRQRIAKVFAFAMSQGIAATNPAAIVAGALQSAAEPREQPALLDIAAARQLIADVEQLDAPAVLKLASRFLALTAVRRAALLGMRWNELEGVDWSTGGVTEPMWRVPAGRMKLRAGKKALAKYDHVVPLAPAAIDVLRAARTISGSAELVFPRPGENLPLRGGALRDLYVAAGYAGRHVPHGWRATFSTIMNEAMPVARATIDQALAHSPKDKVEAAYNRSAQLGRRREIFDAWSKLLFPDD